jgi:sporulation-control protein spo0M
MGFLDKIKNTFNIGGVKLELQMDTNIQKSAGEVSGKIVFTAQSDKKIKKINLELLEEWKIDRQNEEPISKSFILGNKDLNESFEMKAGDIKILDFTLPFQFVNSENDTVKDMGGAVSLLGKAGALIDHEKSIFTFTASADIEGTAFGPNDVKIVYIK